MKMENQNGRKYIDEASDLGSELSHCLTQFKTSFTNGKLGLLPLIVTHQSDKNLYLSNEAKCGKH